MQKLLVIFFFFCATLINSQSNSSSIKNDINNLWDDGIELSQNKSYDLSLSKLKEAQSLWLTHFEPDIEYAYLLSYIGKNLFNLNKLPQAIESYNESYTLIKKENRLSADLITIIHDIVLILHKTKQYKEAIPYCKELLKIIEITHGKKHYLYAKNLNLLANFHSWLDEYNEAIHLYNEAIPILEFTLGKTHSEYRVYLDNLAMVLYKNKDYDTALEINKTLKKLTLKDVEKNTQEYKNRSSTYYNRLTDIASSYYENGTYKKVIPLLTEVIEHIKLNHENDNKTYRLRLDNLAKTYVKLEQYDNAIPLYKDAITNIELHKNVNLPEYLTFLYNLAYAHETQKQYNQALTTYKKALKHIEKHLGKNTREYALCLNNISKTYFELNQYELALPIAKELLKLTEKVYGKTHSSYRICIDNLADIYNRLEQYEKANKLYEEALKLTEQDIADDDPNYGLRLYKIASTHEENEDYGKAIPLYNKALEATKKHYGEKDELCGDILNDLAGIYNNLGQNQKAIDLYYESLEIKEAYLENNNYRSYAVTLGNLASLYNDTNLHDRAILLCNVALQRIKMFNGKHHESYGAVLNILAGVYRDLKDFDKAKELYLESLENVELNFDKTHADYGIRLNNLAIIHKKTGNHNEAIQILLEAKHITENEYGKNNTNYRLALNNLGITYADYGQYQEAITLLSEANNITWNNLKSVFAFTNENERKSYLKTISNNFDVYQSINKNNNFKSEEFTALNLNNLYVLKGLLQSGYTNMLKDLTQLNNEDITNLIADYRSSYALLSKEITTPIKDRVYNVDSLQNYVQQKEAVLVKKHSEVFGSNELVKDWKSIQNHLKSDELIIEFSKFQYRNSEGWTKDQLYMAYVFDSKSSSPTPIYLFNEDELKQVLNNTIPSNLYKTRGSKAKSGRANTSEALYNLVWKPIEGHFSNKKTIYFSPSGTLNQLALTILQNKDKQTMLSRYDMHQMTNTASLLKKKKKTEKEPAAFIGGIQYDFNPDKASLQQKETVALNLFYSTNSNNHIGTWPYLSGTELEVNMLNLMYKKKNLNTTIVSGEYATEEWFKSLSGNSPKVLHVATHGFFFEDNNDSLRHSNRQPKYTFAKDPLLRSGLILAHGNYTWKNGTNTFNEEDGVATAFEISKLDFQNTDLVVLSACETGLGDIDGSEGVYGLQRAFKMAGVDLIMMSLWEVPDKETAEFMELFYSNWLSGQNIREAFRNTQLEMSNTYNDSPEKWAAFVLVE